MKRLFRFGTLYRILHMKKTFWVQSAFIQGNKKLHEQKITSLISAIKKENDNDKEVVVGNSKLCRHQDEFEGLPDVRKKSALDARNLLSLESVENSLNQGSVSENTSGIEANDDDNTLFVSEDFVEDLEDREHQLPDNATESDSKLGILEGLWVESTTM